MTKLSIRTNSSRSWFGDFALIAFLLTQMLDGVLTYVGVASLGTSAEANPLLGWLMATLGQGPALAGTKLMTGGFGIALHLSAVHRIVALLALFYVAVAILPWLMILYA